MKINFTLEGVQKHSEYRTAEELLEVIEPLQGRAYTIHALTGFLTFMGFESKYVRRDGKVVKGWNCRVKQEQSSQNEQETTLDPEEEPELSKEELEKLFSPQVNEDFAAEQRRKLGL